MTDFSNKFGVANNDNTAMVTDLTAINEASFTSGDALDAGTFALVVDTSGGNIDASVLPTSLTLSDGTEAFEDGTIMALVKGTNDGNRITFADPLTGINYRYVNRIGESMNLRYDTSTGTPRWVRSFV